MKHFVWLVLLVIIIGGGYWLSRSYTTPPGVPAAEPTNAPTTPAPQPQAAVPALSVREINLASGYFFFKPSQLVLKKGQPVKLTFQNTGVHTFTVEGLGINQPLREGLVTVEFTPDKTGTFEFYCAVPGHKQSGQVGTLTVE